jgi:hypothetical protein
MGKSSQSHDDASKEEDGTGVIVASKSKDFSRPDVDPKVP